MDYGFDDWIYWHFFTITVDYNSSHIELLLNDVCLTNLTHLELISTTRIHESAAFYNFHAARMEDTTLNSSSVVLLVVVGVLCLATCYLVTTPSLLYVVTGT
jgi:hypothetical protein